MRHGGRTLSSTHTHTLTAPHGARRNGNGATFVSSSLGRDKRLAVSAGGSRERAPRVAMTFRNTGTKTWRAGHHALGTQCPQDNTVLTGSPRIALGHDVGPGEEHAFAGVPSVACCSDLDIQPAGSSTRGSVGWSWQMVEDGVEWFGEYSGETAKVECIHAPYALQQPPIQPSHPAPELPRRFKLSATTIPVVFYVHSRPEYFSQSMDALASAAGVADTLIVISHDGLYPEMDAIVDRLSQKLGSEHAGVYQLVHSQCEDENPTHRHDGNKVVKVKAHWWWMMERVWELLPDTYSGPVLFLEEDHILSPDALTALRAMHKAGSTHGCSTQTNNEAAATSPGCFGYCLGSRTKAAPTVESTSDLRQTFGFHNTGYAFHRHVWQLFQKHEASFWAGGYGWDWTVWRLMQRQEGDFPRTMLYPQVSRVRNAGVKGGVTVDGSSQLTTWLISGIPVSGKQESGQMLISNVDEFTLRNDASVSGSGSVSGSHIDGVDPLEIDLFVGQDHYDCGRFAKGSFGAVREQLDCPLPSTRPHAG